MLNCVATVRNAETKFEVKAFQQAVTKIVLLNHAELVDLLLTHHELHPAEKHACQTYFKMASKEQMT